MITISCAALLIYIILQINEWDFPYVNLDKQWKPSVNYQLGTFGVSRTRSTEIGHYTSFKVCWAEILGLISIPPKENNKNVSRTGVARISTLKN